MASNDRPKTPEMSLEEACELEGFNDDVMSTPRGRQRDNGDEAGPATPFEDESGAGSDADVYVGPDLGPTDRRTKLIDEYSSSDDGEMPGLMPGNNHENNHPSEDDDSSSEDENDDGMPNMEGSSDEDEDEDESESGGRCPECRKDLVQFKGDGVTERSTYTKHIKKCRALGKRGVGSKKKKVRRKKKAKEQKVPSHLAYSATVCYIALDVETTGSSRAVHEICELGAHAFRFHRPKAPTAHHVKVEGVADFSELIKSSDEHVWSEIAMSIHNIKPTDVAEEEKFPVVWAKFVAFAEKAMASWKGAELCTDVCLVCHNAAADFNWLMYMFDRFQITPPEWMRWGLDTLSMVAHTAEFKLTKKMRSDKEAAPAGNYGHGLADIYKVVTGKDHKGHHRATADAVAAARIAEYNKVWDRRFNKGGGIFDLQQDIKDKADKVKATRERK